MKVILSALAISVFSISVAEASCTNIKRLPVFNYQKHASGEADFSGLDPKTRRNIVVRHGGGISRVTIKAQRGATGRYVRSGSGAPLPVTVSVTENLCKSGSTNLFTKKLHARLPNAYTTKFYIPFKTSQNQPRVIALAQTVLRATYCPKGEIKLNPNFQYVETKSGQPVVRTAPVAGPWGNPPFDAQWIVQFTCSEWREAQ